MRRDAVRLAPTGLGEGAIIGHQRTHSRLVLRPYPYRMLTHTTATAPRSTGEGLKGFYAGVPPLPVEAKQQTEPQKQPKHETAKQALIHRSVSVRTQGEPRARRQGIGCRQWSPEG